MILRQQKGTISSQNRDQVRESLEGTKEKVQGEMKCIVLEYSPY